jgi:predicted NBD/HSP70 family sugar kinase
VTRPEREWRHWVGRDLEAINVSHGLGVGLILDGKLFRGRHGNAGEVASLLEMLGRLPVPNLETLRASLAREGIRTTGVTDLLTRYRDDWPGVASWVEGAAPSFSFLASVFRQTLDCDAIVFGGRLPQQLSAHRRQRTLAGQGHLAAPEYPAVGS